MSQEIKNVSLSFCCTKDWNSLTTVDEQRKFCSSCKKNVIDFANSNAHQLTQALKSNKNVCGRFKASQMNVSFLKYAAAIATAVSVACSTPDESIPPLNNEPSMEVTEEEFLMGDIFTGVIELPDSVNLYETSNQDSVKFK